MKRILITGVDGSGKTTILNQIKKISNRSIGIINVPQINTSQIIGNNDLKKASFFVNKLSELADQEKIVSFKIISMFSSMILFDDLCNNLNSNIIFSERHPIIDTIVYAKIYNKYLNPNLLQKKHLEWLNDNYNSELKYIIDRISLPVKLSNNGLSYDLLWFLDSFFKKSKNFSIMSMHEIFNIPKPDKIYLLDAKIETLMFRLNQRRSKEIHETEQKLIKMKKIYLSILLNSNTDYEIISTDSQEGSDKIINDCFLMFKNT